MSLLSSRLRRSAVLAVASFVFVMPGGWLTAAVARPAPDGFADLAEKLLPSVVNISTTQTLKPEQQREHSSRPKFPPGSPFEEFFAFYRSLQAYREALNGRDTSFVLSPEGNFFRFFQGWSGSLGPPSPAGTAPAAPGSAAPPVGPGAK